MDIVEWNEDPAIFISNALNPAQVVDVVFDETQRACTVVVPDFQLSLAIGKRGQNARLAAKLTGFKIDIKPESEWEALKAEAPVTEAEEIEEVEETEE
jgi:N utilization substance protein A